MTVTAEWARLLDVLREVAPSTANSFRPPASREVLARSEARTGTVWPPELREFFSLHDGQIDNPPESAGSGELLPMQHLLSLDQVTDWHAMSAEVWRELADADTDYYEGGYDGVCAQHPNAGSTAMMFLPSYIPIAELDACAYFCDTRPGEHHGCVRQFDKYSADSHGPAWSSISAMLAGIRTCITDSLPIGYWVPVIENDALLWEIADNSQDS
ncbi:SMI1/KNR4 family protein [Rhodococcus sp. UNC363MFTsu5.1]|uniref:SMI1/KNR4 family protein n=1 Tax=Rhodococcus sp. UNC363MFTsu5.1 TaxID=1449069 RepID=UPI0009DCB7B3|nr:SMI1/KNR4 family protein [Rhodococcus sp. UNC363MFTsu5.1]